MVEVQEQRCPRCGGALDAGPTGSITQWLRVCHCKLDVKDEPDIEVSKLQICYSCGRRIGGGRLGSLTQWIFRPDLCDCDKPEPRDIDEANLEIADVKGLALLVEDEQLEMEVDSAKWPSLRYKPLALLGSGGFGTIYRCQDRLLNKTIALKMMRHLTPQQMVAFQHEAKATSRFKHPNIVQVYDFGATDSGAPFMTMEYVNGISLDQWVEKNGTLNVNQAISVFRKVCDALAHAHRAGVLHRDIKSSNVLLIDAASENPEVKLIDFGVALFRTEEGVSLHVQGSTIAGSPNYMAPDQILGKQYDERSEVYGIGCTIFEALTGRTPFEGEHTLDTLRQQASLTPPRLSDIKPQDVFEEELEELVARCLSKDQEARFQSMKELEEALEGLKDQPEEVLLPEPELVPAPVVPPTDRKSLSRASPIVVALLIALIAVGSIGGWMAYHKATKIAETEMIPSKVPDVQKSVSGAAETLLEADRPRFIMAMKGGRDWLIAKGAVTDDDLIELKGRTDYHNLALVRDGVTGKGLVNLDASINMLTLSNTLLSDRYLPLLKKHKDLEFLEVDNTLLTDHGLVHLTEMPSLRSLNIGNDRITDAGIGVLVQIKRLHRLELTDAPKITAAGLQTLSKAPHLKQLVLKNFKVGSHDLSWLKKLPNLESIEFANSGIDDKALELLATTRLERIRLFNNKEITNSGLKKLGRIKRLKVLEIEDSPAVTQEALVALRRMNPRLEINPIDPAKAAKKKVRDSGFKTSTDTVLRDMLEINQNDTEIFRQGAPRSNDIKGR